MARILIIGGGGMIGQKLASAIARGDLPGGPHHVDLLDIAFPPEGAPAAARHTGDVTRPQDWAGLIAARPDMIFHLASIVSGEAEADFDKGWQTNMLAFWSFLQMLRAEHEASGGAWRPRVVFTSSIAVFGPPFPERINDDFLAAPQTSYGAQKAACELMLADFSRKGFINGISLRLPTICVRPGQPNAAASGFFSGIIREPLNGQPARLPVSTDVRHWLASPRAAVGFLIHAADLDTARLDGRRALNLPGVSCTVAQQIEALRDIAGHDAVALIRHDPDKTIMRIVAGWPRDFAPERALALGFRADADIHAIIRAHIEDELTRR